MAQIAQITRKLEFDAGHRVMGHEGKCASVHGHRYVVEVTVEAEQLDEIGRVVDFSVIKELVGGWVDAHWDHGYIARTDDPIVPALKAEDSKLFLMPDGMNPTAENMVEIVVTIASAFLEGHGLSVVKVRLYETPNCWAEWVKPPPRPPGREYQESS